MTTLHFQNALLPTGWAEDVAIPVGSDGTIGQIQTGVPSSGASIRGVALPGMPNLHSHAFQRAMAGLGEVSGPLSGGDEDGAGAEPDSFWTWRKTMYGFLAALTPDDLQAIACHLYVDMLKVGYTSVAEFHYVHHDPDGKPYADRAEMSRRTIAAAREVGLGITQLPVLYNYGGFGGQPPHEGQRRFLNDADRFMDIVSTLHADHGNDPGVRIGIAPHSLRAVTPELLRDVLSGLNDMDHTAPVHIHIAEQIREVDDCLAWSGKRPVEWLLDEFPIDPRWCLVHATHMTDRETTRFAATGAVAGLCPATEANLGDGLFPARLFMDGGGDRGGVMGIGSDSHISVNVKEELRLLEYGQRLFSRERTVLAGGPERSTGRRLYEAALRGGAQACGRPVGALMTGKQADIVVLDTERFPLAGRTGDAVLDAWLFAADHNPVRDVYTGGTQVISNGQHQQQDAIELALQKTMKNLTGSTG